MMNLSNPIRLKQDGDKLHRIRRTSLLSLSAAVLLCTCMNISHVNAFSGMRKNGASKPVTQLNQPLFKRTFFPHRGGSDNGNVNVNVNVNTAPLQQSSSDNDNDNTGSISNSNSNSNKSKNKQVPVPAPPPQPTLNELRNFYFPCLALWTAGPLLSLVDTATVGLSAPPGQGAVQLGSLGPATTFIDGATYLFAFLNVATTNLYASAKAENNEDKCESVVRTSGKISILCGLFLVGLLFSAGKTLLALYMGSTAAQTLLTPASKYVWIRALSMPTSLFYGVIQASLLGAKDSLTPVIAILYSTVVNVVGDISLVKFLGMGVQGAAIATVLAQWAGTFAMMGPAKKKLVAGKSLFILTNKQNKQEKTDNHVSSSSFLKFAAPVLTLILGKLAAFGFMTHVAAAVPGQPTALASHQIILSLFFFISPFLEVMSQTAQTFLPQFYQNDATEWKESANQLARRMLRLGILLGAAVSCVAGSIPRFFPGILTRDKLIWDAVRPLAKPLVISGFLTAPVAVSEGVLLARRELSFLAGVYLLSTALLPQVLLKIKHNGNADGVVQVWMCFAAFQLFRAACFTGKLWGRQLLGKVFGLKKKIKTDQDDVPAVA